MSKTPSKTVFLPWSRNACSQQFYSDAKIIGLLHLIALLQIDIYIYIYKSPTHGSSLKTRCKSKLGIKLIFLKKWAKINVMEYIILLVIFFVTRITSNESNLSFFPGPLPPEVF